MSNMGYCRFQNTASDLQDCFDHLHDELSADEHQAREEIVTLCVQIIEAIGGMVEDDLACYDAAAKLPTDQGDSQ